MNNEEFNPADYAFTISSLAKTIGALATAGLQFDLTINGDNGSHMVLRGNPTGDRRSEMWVDIVYYDNDQAGASIYDVLKGAPPIVIEMLFDDEMLTRDYQNDGLEAIIEKMYRAMGMIS